MAIKENVRWGISVRVITIIGAILLLVGVYYLIYPLFSSMNWLNLTIAIFILSITIYFVLESPQYIELEEFRLILHKIAGRVIVDFNQINKIEPYKPDGSEIRLFGSGGFFGFVGKFKNANIGSYQSYVGDYSQAFRVQTKNGKNYVFSCENRDSIINSIKEQIK
ncbi:hypothetical protein FACS189474_0770 [Bacteroidia bacterium]|nr:hypothetical protein FACS189474_0770 [Bacteroidia bacterium]